MDKKSTGKAPSQNGHQQPPHEHGESENENEYEEGQLLRLEDLCLIDNDRLAVADHANGILIFDVSNKTGQGSQLVTHLNSDKDTLAFSVKYDATRRELYALILDVPGWKLNVYDEKNDWSLARQVLAPNEPEVARMKLRWLTVTSDGHRVFLVAAGNVWSLQRHDDGAEWTWTLLHSDKASNAWLSQLTPMGAKEPDKFLICCKGTHLQRMALQDGNRFVVEKCDAMEVPKEIQEIGAFAVDNEGNLLVSDWTTGQIFLKDMANKTAAKVLGNVGAAESYVMATASNSRRVYVGCKSSLQVRAFNY